MVSEERKLNQQSLLNFDFFDSKPARAAKMMEGEELKLLIFEQSVLDLLLDSPPLSSLFSPRGHSSPCSFRKKAISNE